MPSRRHRIAFEDAQARINVEIKITLALLQLLVLIGEDFDLPTKARDFGIQQLNLVEQLDDSQILEGLIKFGKAFFSGFILRIDFFSQRFNLPTRLIVVKQPSVCIAGAQHRGKQHPREQQQTQGSRHPSIGQTRIHFQPPFRHTHSLS